MLATTMGAGGNLEGRLFQSWAISVNNGESIILSGISVIDLGVLSTLFIIVASAVTNGVSSVITGILAQM
jgi:hypothetical protein